jgi:hypothetical protein
MKCPKCGFSGPDHLDTCKKCGKDLSAEKVRLGLNRPRSIRLREPQTSPPSPSEEGRALSLDAVSRSENHREAGLGKEPGLFSTSVPPPLSPRAEEAPAPDPSPAPRQTTAAPVSEEMPVSLDEEEEFGLPSDQEPVHALEEESFQPAKTSLDDFEFPNFSRTESTPETNSGEKNGLADFSLTEPVEEAKDVVTGTPPQEGFDLDGIGAPEISIGAEELARPEAENSPPLAPWQKAEVKTRLLNAEEIEDILRTELPHTPKDPGPKLSEKAKTQLLDEDQLSDILAELDNEPSKPD